MIDIEARHMEAAQMIYDDMADVDTPTRSVNYIAQIIADCQSAEVVALRDNMEAKTTQWIRTLEVYQGRIVALGTRVEALREALRNIGREADAAIRAAESGKYASIAWCEIMTGIKRVAALSSVPAPPQTCQHLNAGANSVPGSAVVCLDCAEKIGAVYKPYPAEGVPAAPGKDNAK
jgi:hypothetical protein